MIEAPLRADAAPPPSIPSVTPAPMPTITFIEADGTTHVTQAAVGKSVMQVAVDHLVPGILGDCGGCCSCATCHGYVDPAWAGRLPTAAEDERFMLEGALDVTADSRLCCQIKVVDSMDGLIVRVPAVQS